MAATTQTKEDIAACYWLCRLVQSSKTIELLKNQKKCTTTRNRFYRVRKNGIIPKTTF
jgi:hypothetical protein